MSMAISLIVCLKSLVPVSIPSDVPDFVLNQRMIHDYYLCHNIICPPVCFYTFYLSSGVPEGHIRVPFILYSIALPSGHAFLPEKEC